MNAITIWNKGKRTWPLKNSEGVDIRLEPQESVQVEEVYGLRMVAAYPKDLTTTGVAGPSIDDIKRREQSLRDREANLDAREKALEGKEEALDKRESNLDAWGKRLEAREKAPSANATDETKETPVKKAGRPLKSDKVEAEK
jgi:hypothetical protein